MRIVPVAGLVFAAITLSGPAAAGGFPPASDAPGLTAPGGRATSVVVRIDGGISPHDRWLWYDAGGVARSKGMLGIGPGNVRSRVDFAQVERIVGDAALCTGNSTPGRPVGMDMFYYKVTVRCGDRWRFLTATEAADPPHGAQVRYAIRGLEHLAATLRWKTTDENVALPEFEEPPGSRNRPSTSSG